MNQENLETKGFCDKQYWAMILEAFRIAINIIKKCAEQNNCPKGRNIAETLCIIAKNINENKAREESVKRQIQNCIDLIKGEQCIPKNICSILNLLLKLISAVGSAEQIIKEMQEFQAECYEYFNKQFMEMLKEDYQ